MGLTKITSRILDSSGVTILGTIATGVWQGTAINQTYLVGQSGTNTGDETLARINALDITELGTISSGVWNGTAINQTYLVGQSGTNTGDQTTISGNAGTVTNGVYTVGNQTIGGVKTFSSGITQSSGTLQIKNASGDGSGLKLYQAGSDVSTISNHYAGDIAFNTANTSQKMIIKNSGNVGIGTSSPGASKLTVSDGVAGYSTANILLQVKRNATNSNDDTSKASIMLANNSNAFQIAYGGATDRLRFINGGGTEQLTMLNGGNVGIGATSPDSSDWNSNSRLLHIYQNTTNGSLLKLESSNTSLVVASGNSQAQIGTVESVPLKFYTNTTERMSISSGGDVTLKGNGTTSALLFGQSSYARIINTSGQTLYVDSDVHEFRTNGGVGKLTISSTGKAEFRSDQGAGNAQISARSNSSTNVNYGGIAIGQNSGGRGGYVTMGDTNATNNYYYEANTFTLAATANAGLKLRAFASNTRGITIGSSWANDLNAYEEGTWDPTPGRTSGTQPTVSTYAYRNGTYTKVGRLVVIMWDFAATVTAQGSSAAISIKGLPFPVGSAAATGGAMAGYTVANFRASSLYANSTAQRVLGGFAQQGDYYIYVESQKMGTDGFNSGGSVNSYLLNTSSARSTGFCIYFTD